MTVTPVSLTTDSDTTNTTSGYTTASITPTAGRVILVGFMISVGSGSTPTPTVTGCGLTWTQVGQSVVGTRTVHVFRGTGTPSAGALTIAGDGVASLTSGLWNVTEFSSADTVNPIVQEVDTKPGTATNVNVAFPSTVDPANGAYAVVAMAAQVLPSAGTGWTAMGTTSQSAPTSGLIAEAASSAPQNVAASWSTAANSFVVGVEIKAAAAGTPATVVGATATASSSAAGGTAIAGALITGATATASSSAAGGVADGGATIPATVVGATATASAVANAGVAVGGSTIPATVVGATATGSAAAAGGAVAAGASVGGATATVSALAAAGLASGGSGAVQVANSGGWGSVTPLVWNGSAWVPTAVA